MIPVYKPYLPKYVTKFAHDAIDSSWISSSGQYLNKTIELIKNKFGYENVLLTNNGTAAGHLMSIGLEYKHQTKKIVVPNNIYISAWNMLKINPKFEFEIIDANLETWCGDYYQFLSKNPKNNVILIVHNINSIVNVPKLKNDFPDNIYIEDNCEGFLGKYNNFYTGTESEITTLSFFGNKNVTSGEGGAVIVKDKDCYEYLNSVRCQGITNEKFIFDKIGYNYRMTNIEAALLYGQLKYVDEIIELKTKIFESYRKKLKDIEWIEFQKTDESTISGNWMFGIRLKNNKLGALKLQLFENGIENRTMFPPITYHKHYEDLSCDIHNASKLYDSCLILPSYPELTTSEINQICDIIIKTK